MMAVQFARVAVRIGLGGKVPNHLHSRNCPPLELEGETQTLSTRNCLLDRPQLCIAACISNFDGVHL